VDKVLRNLSLPDLARLYTTCKAFQDVYCRALAAEQKARCDLAHKTYGRAVIRSIAALITPFSEGTFPDAEFLSARECWRWMPLDGKLYLAQSYPGASREVGSARCKLGALVCVQENSSLLQIVVAPGTLHEVHVKIDGEDGSRCIAVPGLCFAQALFGERPGLDSQTAWPHAIICIRIFVSQVPS
jgi:hypothetical protein